MKRVVLKGILLAIVSFVLIYYIHVSVSKDDHMKDKVAKKNHGLSTVPQKKFGKSNIRQTVHDKQIIADETNMEIFTRFIKRLAPFLKTATLEERNQIQQILGRLRSHEVTEEDIRLLRSYIQELDLEELPSLYAMIFTYVNETDDRYLEDIMLRLFFEDRNPPPFPTDDVSPAVCNELETSCIALFNKTKSSNLKQFVIRVLANICDESPTVFNFFVDVLNSAPPEDYFDAALVAAGAIKKLHVEVAKTMTQRYSMGQLSLYQIDFLIGALSVSYGLLNQEVFLKIEPLIIDLLNHYNSKKGDETAEGYMTFLMHNLAVVNQTKYLPMIWEKFNELVQKAELGSRDRANAHTLACGLFKCDDKNILGALINVLIQNKNLQEMLANALWARPSYNQAKHRFPDPDNPIIPPAEQYLLDRLVRDVIPFVQDDDDVVAQLVRYVRISGSKQHIEALKEKLPYLSELKKKIISAELK